MPSTTSTQPPSSTTDADGEVDELVDDAPTPRATTPVLATEADSSNSQLSESTGNNQATQDITPDLESNLVDVPQAPIFIDDPAQYPDRMPPPPIAHKNYYPDSAYGPHGPRGNEYSARAAEDTANLAASGYFNGGPLPPGSPPPSTRDSRSPSVTDRSPPPGGPSGVQFFSSPPIPVYHTNPQSMISYYPAPHHQAQILAQARYSQGTAHAPNGTPPSNLDPALTGPPPPPALPIPPPQPQPQAQFLQGGVIYTPSAMELGLHSLSDGPPGEKPPYPYPTIIRCAILGSPRQRLTLSEIYLAMESRYPWFKTAGQGWKNSVRHNLSLNKCFAKISRPITEPGKGAYWTVDLAAGEGNKRPRKRNKKPKKTQIPANGAAGAYRDNTNNMDMDDDDDDDALDDDDGADDDDTTTDTTESEASAPGYTYPPPARNPALRPRSNNPVAMSSNMAGGSPSSRPRPRAKGQAAGGRRPPASGGQIRGVRNGRNAQGWDSD